MPPKKTVKNYLKNSDRQKSSGVAVIEVPSTDEVNNAFQFGLKINGTENILMSQFFEHVKIEDMETILENIQHGKGNNESKFRSMLEKNGDVQNLFKVKTFFDDIFGKTEQLLNVSILSECSKNDAFSKDKLSRYLEILIGIRKGIAQSSASHPDTDANMRPVS